MARQQIVDCRCAPVHSKITRRALSSLQDAVGRWSANEISDMMVLLALQA